MHLNVSSIIKGHATRDIFSRLLLLLFLFFLTKSWQFISPLLLIRLSTAGLLFFNLCKSLGVIIGITDELPPLLSHDRDHLILVASVENHIFLLVLLQLVVFILLLTRLINTVVAHHWDLSEVHQGVILIIESEVIWVSFIFKLKFLGIIETCNSVAASNINDQLRWRLRQ
jgi:hypothetical protein